jgi:predicted RNA-binding protein
MCNEAPFVLFHAGGEKPLADIDVIRAQGGKVVLVDLRGQQTVLPGRVTLVDLVARRIEVE